METKRIQLATAEDINKLNENLGNKLDNSTDIENAGKAVVVGEDGTLGFGDVASTVSNPNLLDNGWFNVNSRGQSEYITQNKTIYTLDRWRMGWYAKVTKTDEVLIVENVNNDDLSGIHQFVDTSNLQHLKGQKFTLSVLLSDGRILTNTSVHDEIRYAAINLAGVFKIQSPIFTSSKIVYIHTYKGNNISIAAIKLELGSVSTLHLDTAPNPAEEKLRCMLSTADPDDPFANKKLQSAVGDEWDKDVIYKVGDMFIAGNTLWKTKVQHSGEIPVEGSTYVEKTSVAKELQAIWNAINS